MLSPVEIQFREFIDAVMRDASHHEAYIRADLQAVNNAHIEYLPGSDTIVVDYRFKYPATCNNLPKIRHAIYCALMY